jgi:metal-dependent amidase/aminoacylase/carboxypeptidase family protein
MAGTIRAFDAQVRDALGEDVRRIATGIAGSAGATAKVAVVPMYDETINDAALAERMAPVLRLAADGRVGEAELPGASEDFSFFAKKIPGLYVFLGVTPNGQDPAKAAPNHSPEFFVDEKALVVGTRALASLAVNFLTVPP